VYNLPVKQNGGRKQWC